MLLKEFDGSVRPSDMVFDTIDLWVRVLDLPMDMMNRVYVEMIGGWIGRYISVDVDQDGIAWGKELRIRVVVRVDQPLLRGVPLKESDEQVKGTWFDIKYEKVPHFCFSCGRIVHSEEGCPMEKSDEKQWGEWLRASPRRSSRAPPPSRPSVSSGSYASLSSGGDGRYYGGVSIRDIPPRRNLAAELSASGSSRTGVVDHIQERGEVTSPGKRHGTRGKEVLGRAEQAAENNLARRGTFARRPRVTTGVEASNVMSQIPGGKSKKRGVKAVWLPVRVQVVGDEQVVQGGKRQRTASVFDRIEDPSGSHDEQRDSVFNRIKEPAADLAMQGRRDQ
jgi:hypothetical protein